MLFPNTTSAFLRDQSYPMAARVQVSDIHYILFYADILVTGRRGNRNENGIGRDIAGTGNRSQGQNGTGFLGGSHIEFAYG